MRFTGLLALGIIVTIAVVSSEQDTAYGHGCQAQGGCCVVGGCVDMTANSPIYLMFVAIGFVGALLFKFYGVPVARSKLCSCLNIYVYD